MVEPDTARGGKPWSGTVLFPLTPLFKCQNSKCNTCNKTDVSKDFNGVYNTTTYQSTLHDSVCLPVCRLKNVVYLIKCDRCGLQYVGETGRPFHLRFNEHKSYFKLRSHTELTRHFNNSTCSESYVFQVIEVIDQNHPLPKAVLLDKEEFWIKTLQTQFPFGFNTADRRIGQYGSTLSAFHPNRNQRKIKEVVAKVDRLEIISTPKTLFMIAINLLLNIQRPPYVKYAIPCSLALGNQLNSFTFLWLTETALW